MAKEAGSQLHLERISDAFRFAVSIEDMFVYPISKMDVYLVSKTLYSK